MSKTATSNNHVCKSRSRIKRTSGLCLRSKSSLDEHVSDVQSEMKKRQQISRKVSNHYFLRLYGYGQNSFELMTLNSKNDFVYEATIDRNSMSGTKNVFEKASALGATSAIFVHILPFDKEFPSKNDIALTNQWIKVGKCLGIEVLDHVKIRHLNWFSFLKEGHMPNEVYRNLME